MAGFTTPLELEYIDGRKWKITKPFEYCCGEPGAPIRVEIPAGFVTDFASIPEILWNILPPTGSYGKAAVVHDWLYTHRVVMVHGQVKLWSGQRTLPFSSQRLVTRAYADSTLYEAMGVLGTGIITRLVIYLGVRMGGWIAWRDHRKAEAHGQ